MRQNYQINEQTILNLSRLSDEICFNQIDNHNHFNNQIQGKINNHPLFKRSHTQNKQRNSKNNSSCKLNNIQHLELQTNGSNFNDIRFNIDPWDYQTKSFTTRQLQLPQKPFNTQKQGRKLSKSFNITLKKRKKETSVKYLSSTSLINQQKQPSIILNKNQFQRKSVLSTINAENYQFSSDHFKYTSQQKDKIQLIQLHNQQKNKKMSEILRIKIPNFDKTIQKIQKIENQSKNLIAALQKLSNDKILSRSIQRAVSLLRKNNYRHKISSSKFLIKSPQKRQNNFITSSQCQKVHNQNVLNPKQNISNPKQSILNSKENTQNLKQNILHLRQNKSSQKQCLVQNVINGNNFLSISKLKNESVQSIQKMYSTLQKVNISKQIHNQKRNCKVSFKPKRNWLIQSKNKIIQYQQNDEIRTNDKVTV